VYGGLNLEGSIVATADDWNRSYYGRDLTPVDIVLTGNAHNPQADRLAEELSRAANRQRTAPCNRRRTRVGSGPGPCAPARRPRRSRRLCAPQRRDAGSTGGAREPSRGAAAFRMTLA
jgi:hypothetical protein